MSCEIGGGNGLEPLAIGARMGLPVVDADFMGRAFPELQVPTSQAAHSSNRQCLLCPICVKLLAYNCPESMWSASAGTEVRLR